MPRDLLPKGVFEKHGAYYLVRARGTKRVWMRLCSLKEGLPAMYAALAKLTDDQTRDDRMPALCVAWLRDVGSRHSKKTLKDDTRRCAEVAARLVDFRADQVTPPKVVEFLKVFQDRPRTYNAYRALLRDLMRYAEERGYRPAGSNPVTSVRTMATPARQRYITDSELRRIKVAAMMGKDGKRTRSGIAIVNLMEVAYLTGQRVSDLINLRWSKKHATDERGAVVAPYIDKEGLHFAPAKVAKTTGAKIRITWTPRLEAAIERMRAQPKKNITHVFSTQVGQPYKYAGVRMAWLRALERAGMQDTNFHDLRAKALTDTESAQGMQAARTKGAHSTEQQTADYVRHKTVREVKATR